MTRIRVRCSPDADDLFMFRALLEGLVDPVGFTFEIDTADTEALNQLASGDGPEVCAVSVGHYPAIADRYQLLPHGGSVGDGYGPVVVSRQPTTLDELAGARVAIPGEHTTAWMVLRLIAPDLRPVVVPITPYERIFEALESGEVDAGLIIHEGRLTYGDHGCHAVVDIGAWWKKQTGLPLPLGANVVRRDLGAERIAALSQVIRNSIRHAADHRDEAIAWLQDRGGALQSHDRLSRYLDMYANDETLDYTPGARQGIDLLYRRAFEAGLVARAVRPDFSP